jgi:hypothetical protein
LLKVFVPVELDEGSTWTGNSRIVVPRELQLHERSWASLALCTLWIGEPDRINYLIATCVLKGKLIEANSDSALYTNTLSSKDGGLARISQMEASTICAASEPVTAEQNSRRARNRLNKSPLSIGTHYNGLI